MENKKRVGKSFRVDPSVVRRLEELAEKEGVSVNVVANRALRRYVEWDSYADIFGLLNISGTLLRHLAEHVPDERMRALGDGWAANRGSEFAHLWFDNENLPAAITILTLLDTYGRTFRLHITTLGPKDLMIYLRHGLGMKWSIFFAAMLESWFGKLKGKYVTRLDVKYSETEAHARVTTAKEHLIQDNPP